VWVRQQIEARGPAASPVEVDVALSTVLNTCIEDSLHHHRALVGVAPPSSQDRTVALDWLRQDFRQGNRELEAWSTLYYRYVRLDLDLQVQDIAAILGIAPRQVRRRLAHGCRRLAEILSRLEASARVSNRRQWLRLKLPPPMYTSLFGVEQTIARLFNLLCAPGPPHTLALVGPGGIGKTTLAHAVAVRLIDDGQVGNVAWIDLDLPTTYSTILARLAHALGYLHWAESSPEDVEANLRVRLAETHVLAVIDNADLLEDLGALLPRLDMMVAPGHLLLTSRHWPPTDVPVQVVQVDALPPAEFAALLHSYARLRHVSQARRLPQDVIDAIYAAVGGNPLAGRLVASQLGALPLDRVLENLSTSMTAHGVGLFDWLFAFTWERLSAAAHQAALAMCLLPPTGVGWHELFAVADLPPDALDHALGELTATSLIDTGGEFRLYTMHALARLFVEDRARHAPWSTVYERLLRRAIDRERRAEAAPYVESEGLSRTLTLIAKGSHIEQEGAALGDLIARVAPAARRSGLWAVWRDALLHAVGRLRAGGAESVGLGRALIELGVAYRWLGDSHAAEATLQEAVAVLGQQGDFSSQAEALLEIGYLRQSMGLTGPAYLAYQRAASAAYRHGAVDLRRRALNGLAGLALHNQRAEEALDLLHQALATCEADQPDGETLSNLGIATLQQGRVDEAIHFQQQALARFEEEGDLPRQARTTLRLGMAYHAAHDTSRALDHLEEGLRMMQTLGDALGQARVLTNLGAVYIHEERWAEALQVWREAIDLQSRLGDEVGMAYTWYNLADLEWRLGREDNTHAALREARQLAERLNLLTLLAHINHHPAGSGP